MRSMSETPYERHRRRQLRLITERALLGDEEQKRLREERGLDATRARAQIAAKDLRLCACARSDGIVCCRRLTPRAGRICWVCWSKEQDGKPCEHRLGAK